MINKDIRIATLNKNISNLDIICTCDGAPLQYEGSVMWNNETYLLYLNYRHSTIKIILSKQCSDIDELIYESITRKNKLELFIFEFTNVEDLNEFSILNILAKYLV